MYDFIYLDIFYIFLGIFILVYLAVFEFLNCNQGFANDSNVESHTISSYGYGKGDGPHIWKHNFPNACGENQSPVNLQNHCAVVIHTETLKDPLEFSREYHSTPCEMYVINDGHTITLYSDYKDSKLPKVRGGPLDGCYELFSINFRWGANDEEGTEHMVDNTRYAMELQVTFMRTGHRNVYIAAEAGDVIIIAYLYQTTPVDNPYLESILKEVSPSSNPYQKCCIQPLPISFLAPCFSKNYFSYVGSLTYPPCTEDVRWIVQPEPLSISCRQIKKFRKIPMLFCSLKNNTRPVQELNSREIIFYD